MKFVLHVFSCSLYIVVVVVLVLLILFMFLFLSVCLFFCSFDLPMWWINASIIIIITSSSSSNSNIVEVIFTSFEPVLSFFIPLSPVSIQTQSLALRALCEIFTQQTQAPTNRNARSKQCQPWLAACQRNRLRFLLFSFSSDCVWMETGLQTVCWPSSSQNSWVEWKQQASS